MDNNNSTAAVPIAPDVASTTTTSTTGGATAPTGTATGQFSAATPVANMADLKEKAPEVYKAMMEGIAMNIVNEMKDHQTRLKELQREAQRNAEGKS